MKRGMTVIVLALAAAVTACTPASQSAAPSPGHAGTRPSGSGAAAAAAPVTAAGCLAKRLDAPLPVWARSGFAPPSQPIEHVIGVSGDIVAILWGGPKTSLYAPPLPNRVNKILWVPRPSYLGGPLRIRATLNGTHRAVTRLLAAVGPSYVNLPAAGCWTLNVRWSGHSDQVQLWYAAT